MTTPNGFPKSQTILSQVMQDGLVKVDHLQINQEVGPSHLEQGFHKVEFQQLICKMYALIAPACSGVERLFGQQFQSADTSLH
jgi:hypothetical protein